jgi:hypothetical protein
LGLKTVFANRTTPGANFKEEEIEFLGCRPCKCTCVTMSRNAEVFLFFCMNQLHQN